MAALRMACGESGLDLAATARAGSGCPLYDVAATKPASFIADADAETSPVSGESAVSVYAAACVELFVLEVLFPEFEPPPPHPEIRRTKTALPATAKHVFARKDRNTKEDILTSL
jgi:hypothetical protein